MEKLPVVSAFRRTQALLSADLRFQDGNSCAQMRRLIVKKLQHERVPLQRLLHDAALHSRAPAVNQANVAQPGGVCFIQVLFDDRRDVARCEGVQVEGPFDGNPQRLALSGAEGVLILHCQAVAGFS
jgi:hypothetical protein